MYALGFLLLASLFWAGLLTPVVRDICLRRGWVDLPDQRRKLHEYPIPRMGGLVLAASYLLSFVLLLLLPFGAANLVRAHLDVVASLLPAALVVLAVGLFDDRYGLSPRAKLTFEIVAAALAFSAGVRISDQWWSFPATILWLVASSNAFNLIDGVDGLAAGVGLFATLTMFAAALLHGNMALALATAPLAGTLLGFLRYNFEPASIYLGDSGSLSLGFLLGCFGVIWSYKSASVVGMAAPALLLSLPFLDVALSMARRFLAMKPVFGADRGHIHHRLLALGLRPRHVALVLYAACGMAALCSVFTTRVDRPFAAMAVVLFAALVILAIQRLGYSEFRAARRALTSDRLRRMVRHEIEVDKFRAEVLAARSPDDFWQRIRRAGRELGLETIALQLDGRSWKSECDLGATSSLGWQTRVPLNERDYVEFRSESQDLEIAQSLVPLAIALREALNSPAGARAPASEPDLTPPPAPVAWSDRS